MFNFVMSLVLLLGAIVGGGATTMAAAQGAQPDDLLYPVKTWSEDMRLGLTANSQERLDLELQFGARRAQEIQRSLAAGGGVSDALLARYQEQLRQQLQLAVGLPADQIIPAFARIRSQAQQQDQIMAQMHLQEQAAIQARDRIRLMLQSQEQLAQAGVDNPDWLRQQLRVSDQTKPGASASAPSAQPASATGTGNPWTTGVPTPGSSYGPGAAQNPWTDTTPVPGSGYGPGTGQDCTPQPGNGGPSGQNGGGGAGKGP